MRTTSTSILGVGLGIGLGLGSLLLAPSCAKPSPDPMETPQPDMSQAPPDMSPPGARCEYQPAPIPTGVGQPIVAGAVLAGVDEAALDLPVGTPLGGYTA